MKTKGLGFVLILLLTAFIIRCGNTSANEASGPSAAYEGSLEVTGIYSTGQDSFTVLFHYEVTSTNDIGGTVDNIKHELTLQDGVLNEEIYVPDPVIYIPGNGAHVWDVNEELAYNGFLPTSAIVTIKVIDDNNNEHYLATDYTTIAWR